jgi:hypothetical protein
MKEFSNDILVTNRNNFVNLSFQRNLCYLRRDIYEHVINNKEEDYFDIDIWCRNRLKNDTGTMKKMISIIVDELEKKGWTCKITFGASALFIYSDKPPVNYFEDGL